MDRAAVDTWTQLDVLLAHSTYLRFSLDSHRDWGDAAKRQWRATLYKETGRVIAKGYGPTREDALAEMFADLVKRERR